MARTGLSLWSLIAPFDSHQHLLRCILWPYLSDCDVMQAMLANTATFALLHRYTVRHAFTMDEVPQSDSAAHYQPRITSVTTSEPGKLSAAFSRLPHVTALDVTLRRKPHKHKRPKWAVRLPPLLTRLHLTVSGRMWQRLDATALPSALCGLTVDDSIVKKAVPREPIGGPLPPHVHTLTVRSFMWNWLSFQQLHLTADSTQLRSLTIAGYCSSPQNEMNGSLLPRSLTLLDLRQYDYKQKLSDLDLPNLVTLRLGLFSQPANGQHSTPITIESFTGLPALRELDMWDARTIRSALPAGALPVTLTGLSLPRNYRAPVVTGALPAALERLRINYMGKYVYGRALDAKPRAMDAMGLEDGCLPAKLLTLTVEQFGVDYPHLYSTPFTYPLSLLPVSLLELRLHNADFDQPLDGLIDLPYLATLSIDSELFEQPLEPISQLARLHSLVLRIPFRSPIPRPASSAAPPHYTAGESCSTASPQVRQR